VENGISGGARPKEAAQIKKWFDHIPYLTNDQKLWRKVSENYAVLSSWGRPISWNEIMTATIAKKKGVGVCAHGMHFPIIADILKVPLYHPGYHGEFNPN
jgi:predicted nucleic acid-binding protein